MALTPSAPASVHGSYIGGIDAGGTTYKCALALADGTLVARERVPVTDPGATLAGAIAFFKAALAAQGGELASIGIASFGPADVDSSSAHYGRILKTPKSHWTGADVRGAFAQAFGCPVNFDTDVNGALLAEMRHGAAQGVSSAAYVTVGTGIGAGIFADGRFIGKPSHPEFGHITLSRAPGDEAFEGTCVFHGGCLEGLASAGAITARFGAPHTLGAGHAAWDLIGDYLGQAALALTLTARPERILFGGGVLLADGLIEKVRAAYTRHINGYLNESDEEIAIKIRTPGLGDDAGLIGGLCLAQDALSARR
jgi:fructokinase